MVRLTSSPARLLASGILVTLFTVGSAGCAPSSSPTSSATATRSATATPTPTPTPSGPPALDPAGSAADNLPFFTTVVAGVWNAGNPATGRSYIDALIAAGFDKAAMQVTSDTTTIGNPAESIQFSVLWHDGQCLVGQIGPATGAPVTAVLPGLGDGACLLGNTRPIDW